LKHKPSCFILTDEHPYTEIARFDI